MKREEFLNKIYALTTQLNELVELLPNIQSLEESNDFVDESKISVLSAILSVEIDAENLSDLYFETETETV